MSFADTNIHVCMHAHFAYSTQHITRSILHIYITRSILRIPYIHVHTCLHISMKHFLPLVSHTAALQYVTTCSSTFRRFQMPIRLPTATAPIRLRRLQRPSDFDGRSARISDYVGSYANQGGFRHVRVQCMCSDARIPCSAHRSREGACTPFFISLVTRRLLYTLTNFQYSLRTLYV